LAIGQPAIVTRACSARASARRRSVENAISLSTEATSSLKRSKSSSPRVAAYRWYRTEAA
jgi:hypothetical protein